MSNVTRILTAIEKGDSVAAEQLLPRRKASDKAGGKMHRVALEEIEPAIEGPKLDIRPSKNGPETMTEN